MTHFRAICVTTQPRVALLLVFLLLSWTAAVWSMSRAHGGDWVDDGEYLIGARTLAEGKGYSLSSRPGRPPAWRAPGLPLVLAGAFAFLPAAASPDTYVRAARIVVTAMGWVWFLAVFLWAQTGGHARLLSLGLVAAIAFHPTTLNVSIAAMSDVPFAAFCWLLLLLWRRAPGLPISRKEAVAHGVLAAVAMLLRTNGATLLPAALTRASLCRRAAWYAAGVAAVVFLGYALVGNAVVPGFYVRQAEVISSPLTAGHLVARNAWAIIQAAAEAAFPVLALNTARSFWVARAAAVGLVALVTACGAVAAVRGNLSRHGALIAHSALTLVLLLLVPWPEHTRLLLPLQPLFLLAFFRGVIDIAQRSTTWPLPLVRRSSVLAVVAMLACVPLTAGLTVWGNWRARATRPVVDAALADLKARAPDDAVVFALTPETIYLYTGRQSAPLLDYSDWQGSKVGAWAPLDAWMLRARCRPFFVYLDEVDPRQGRHFALLAQSRPLTLLSRPAGGRVSIWRVDAVRAGASTTCAKDGVVGDESTTVDPSP